MRKLFLLLYTITMLTQAQANYIGDLYNSSKLYVDDFLLMNDLKSKKVSMIDEDKMFINENWNHLLGKVTKSQEVYWNMEEAPKESFFSADKNSLRKDLDRELSDILFMITEDKSALKYISIISSLKDRISTLKEDITKNKELALLSQDSEDKTSYIEKNQVLLNNIAHYENNIEEVKKLLQFNLSSAGVNFTIEEITVLLSRVDSNDIVQLTLIYNNLKTVTQQLAKLMETTSGDIKATKKYYSMFYILSEMIVYIQQKYIYKMNKFYLPKIDLIITDMRRIKRESKRLLLETKNIHNSNTLNSNIKEQSLTLKVANRYKEDLINQRNQIKKALDKSTFDLKVALNTLKTVQVSFTLLNLIQESRKSFDSLLNIQLPKIIPFENKDILNEYNKITEKISIQE